MTDSNIGCNIINEYSILKKIFSYLLPIDLMSASRVCKNWHSVALRVLHEYGGPYGYVMHYDKTAQFNRKIIPKVILYFSSTHTCGLGQPLYGKGGAFFKDIIKNYQLRGNFYSIRNKIFFASCVEKNAPMDVSFCGALCLEDEQNTVFDSVVLLNDRPGCIVRTYEKLINQKTKLDQILPKNIKGIILLGGQCNFSQRSLRKLLNEMELLNVPMAGGMCTNLREVKTEDDQRDIQALLGITFEGDNVDIHSGVHTLKENIDEFLKKLSARVGPKPKGSIRMAFLFICIDRYGEFSEVNECRLFQKYFPEVPIYGYYSLGEFFFSGDEATLPFKKSKTSSSNMRGFYQQCTSYFIITISNKP